MYNVKVSEKGKKIVFKGREVRTPTIFHNISEKELKLLEVMFRAVDTEFELVEIESQHLKKVAQSLNKDGMLNYKVVNGVVKYCFKEVDLEETKIEEVDIDDLFEGDNTMGKLLKNIE